MQKHGMVFLRMLIAQGDPVNYVDPDGMEPTMEEAGQMSLYMYGVFSLESISGGWNLVYQLPKITLHYLTL